jgi:hypothetical protein
VALDEVPLGDEQPQDRSCSLATFLKILDFA